MQDDKDYITVCFNKSFNEVSKTSYFILQIISQALPVLFLDLLFQLFFSIFLFLSAQMQPFSESHQGDSPLPPPLGTPLGAISHKSLSPRLSLWVGAKTLDTAPLVANAEKVLERSHYCDTSVLTVCDGRTDIPAISTMQWNGKESSRWSEPNMNSSAL